MKFLIDTNIFIPLEPTSPSDVGEMSPAVAQLARLMSQGGHQLYVHPAAREDILRDRDPVRRSTRLLLFGKYPLLPDPPSISPELEAILGPSICGERDWVDHHLIAAVKANAVDFLVTEDRDVRKKAARLSVQPRVTTVSEAISILRDLFDATPRPPPAVRTTLAHALSEADPIFQTFREDYPGFDDWLDKCKREHRQAWIIQVDGPHLAGVAIVKREESGEFGLRGKVLKLCSFKVAEAYNGVRFGELLLKAVFEYAHTNRYDSIYVTIFEKHVGLISLLEDFGFRSLGARTSLRELVLTKPLAYTEQEMSSLDPLEFHVRYGPWAVKVEGVPAFAIPIRPHYHRLLFPEAELQLELLPGANPFGNSIRKAYLSNAATRQITPGANLLFYRSHDIRGFTCLGVAEETVVSSYATEIARYVGKRTVYRFTEIEALCERPVLAILFRQALLIDPPIPLDELTRNDILSTAPRSVVRMSEEAAEWLRARLPM